MKNQKLTQAKINAYDEFYTQRKTIEKELNTILSSLTIKSYI